MGEEVANKEKIKDMVEGRLPWKEVKDIIRLKPKDQDRFWKYLEVLQEKVSWNDQILIRISDHLFVVAKGKGERVVKCDCGQEFVHSGEDQARYAERGFTNDPKRCRTCRDKRKTQGGGRRQPRESYEATCAGCGASTTVPFKPTQGRPVYCRDCFRAQRDR